MTAELIREFAMEIGPAILQAHRTQIIAYASQNAHALYIFVAPYALPAIKAILIGAAIAITAVAIACITKKVVQWIREELKGEGYAVC